ncbi:hypothetical protein BT69DRAFT_1349024 [Atractiella rhizophila]|nr:hypothetical protein BT69DRAFT_1349024 [Atractiella rhizophila]
MQDKTSHPHPFSHIPGVSYDLETGEPFLPLPPPLDKYRLTPWRYNEADIQSVLSMMNDERVYMYLMGPPCPYTIEHAKSWIAAKTENTGKLVTYLRETKSWSDIQKISGCPFEVVRFSENPNSAGAEHLGVIDAKVESMLDAPGRSWNEPFFSDAEFAATQQWIFGDYLSPSHHNKGIMTACMKLLLDQFFDPIMRVKEWRVTAFVGNWASRRVFEKNGFVFTGEIQLMGTLPVAKGGPKEVHAWVLELSR